MVCAAESAYTIAERKRIMRVWLYYRLSRDEDDELNSLRNQRSIIESYAISNGHDIVGESFDDNVSGMHFEREGIAKIYEVVDAGGVHRGTDQPPDGNPQRKGEACPYGTLATA